MAGAIPKPQLMIQESPFNDEEREELKDDVDLHIKSEYVPDLFSRISLEKFRIVQPECLEYPTQSKVQEYQTQLEVDNHRQILAEELVVEQNIDAEFPVRPHMIVNRENDLSLLPLSLLRAAPPLIFQEEDPLNPPPKSQSTYICTISTCSLPFTSKFELFQHNMAHHISKYFSSVQFSEMPNDQFNHYITNLLEGTLDTFDKVDEGYKCSFCSFLFPGREKARNHLVVKHRPNIKEKLVEIQKFKSDSPQTPKEMESSISSTEDTSNITLKRKRSWPVEENRNFKPKRLKSDFDCVPCSKSFSNESSITHHELSVHPEKYLASVKLQVLTSHQFQNCVAHMLSKIVDEFKKKGSKYKCNYCSELICGKAYAKHHLILNHLSIIKERLVDLQNSSDVSMIMNTSQKSNRISFLNAHNPDHSCKICGMIFTQGSFFNQHQSYFHPEFFFESSNFLPSENNEQFKTYIQYVLQKQIEDPVPKERDQVKCRICSKVLSCLKFAKTHLILRHQVFLAEKLEDVQKSGKSFDEIEDELLEMKETKIIEKKLSQAAGNDFSATQPKSYSNTGDTSSKGKANLESNHVCNTCGIFYTKYNKLRRHRSIHHPEMFFENEKHIGLQFGSEGDEMFRKYVLFMLERQVDEEFSKITVSTLPGANLLEELQASVPGYGDKIKYKCNFCSQALCDRLGALSHIVLIHQGNMAKILADFNGKSVEEIKLEMMNFEKCSLKWKRRSQSLKNQLTNCGVPEV